MKEKLQEELAVLKKIAVMEKTRKTPKLQHIRNAIPLLEKIGVINYKYKQMQEKEACNIFPVLRKSDDEVNLHSKFIHYLLDPRGSHGMGEMLGKLFLQVLTAGDKSSDDIQEFNTDSYRALREHKHIDILLTNNTQKQAIIIENKIYAGDQPKQLKRYYDAIKKENYKDKNIWILYLTLDEHEPSKDSGRDLEWGSKKRKVRCISYKREIKRWMELCAEKATAYPALREILFQYKKTILKLTGDTMEEKEKKEIYELLQKHPQSIFGLQNLVQAWDYIRPEIEWKFMEELIKKLRGNGVINETHYEENFSKETLGNIINNKTGAGDIFLWFDTIQDSSGLDLWLTWSRVCDESWIFISPYYKNEECVEHDGKKHKKVKEKFGEMEVKNITVENSADYWEIAYFYLKDTELGIDFVTGNEKALELIDDTKREEAVTKMAEIISEYWKQAKEIAKSK